MIHTSADERGQVYVPGFNWAVMAATIALVLGFRSSGALAAAFGLAEQAKAQGLQAPNATFSLGRESVVACRGRWRGWRERLFSFMHHNARPAAEFFGIPPNQVLEVGAQVELWGADSPKLDVGCTRS